MSMFEHPPEFYDIMMLDGWDRIYEPDDTWEWVKFDLNGKIIASWGDHVWRRDSKAAMEYIDGKSQASSVICL